MDFIVYFSWDLFYSFFFFLVMIVLVNYDKLQSIICSMSSKIMDYKIIQSLFVKIKVLMGIISTKK